MDRRGLPTDFAVPYSGPKQTKYTLFPLQVVPKSTPTEEPPPPYSLEDPLGQMRNTTFF